MEHVTITSLPNGMYRIVPDNGYEIVIDRKGYSEVVVKELKGIEVRQISPEPAPQPVPPTDPVERAKVMKIAEIDAYNDSPSVNSFTISGNTMWLTVEERQQLSTQISASEAGGREEMTRWYGGIPFTFSITLWKQMLVALELYAGDALNVTESHKAAVMAMDNVEDIEAYDITQGYPAKLAF